MSLIIRGLFKAAELCTFWGAGSGCGTAFNAGFFHSPRTPAMLAIEKGFPDFGINTKGFFTSIRGFSKCCTGADDSVMTQTISFDTDEGFDLFTII